MAQNTVFVIGAGASSEVGLPTGEGLKEEISSLLNGSFDIMGKWKGPGDRITFSSLKIKEPHHADRQGNLAPYHAAARHISDVLPLAKSIDNFIDNHRGDECIAFCGKLAIVRAILKAEKNSPMSFDLQRAGGKLNLQNLQNTWYPHLFRLLTENCRMLDLKTRFEAITLIIFNYDRCVEHYLHHALQQYYKIPPREATECLDWMNIYHPYGDVGRLQYNYNPVGVTFGGGEAFGTEPHPEQLLEIVPRIKTFTEDTDPESSEIEEIRAHMAEAKRLVFLGFAFHPLNMELLETSPDTSVSIKGFATTFGISNSDKELIKKDIMGLYLDRVFDIEMTDSKCSSFFSEFQRSLAF
jgi:hypothetical protein